MKIPDCVIIAELQKEKRKWEIERKALREKVEELYAKVVRAENEVRVAALKEVNLEALKEARKDALYKEKLKENDSLRRRNRELSKANKALVAELSKYREWEAYGDKQTTSEVIEKASEWLYDNFYEHPHERRFVCSESFDTMEDMIDRFVAAMGGCHNEGQDNNA